MEVTIKIIHPMYILVATMETIGDMIAGHFFVFTKPSGDTIAGVEIDCYWCDISTWEYDFRKNLSQIIEDMNIILLECHMKGPRHNHATETERRVREVLCHIIGIPQSQV